MKVIRLTEDRKIGYTAAFAILAASLLVLFIPYKYLLPVAALIFAASATVSNAIIKKSSIHSYNKRQVLLIVAVIAVLYLVLYYLTGLAFGFAVFHGTLTLSNLFRYVVPITIIIITTEVIRSALISQRSRVVSVCSYVIAVISEIFIAGGVRDISTFFSFIDFVGMTLFPAITENVLYHYLSKRYGMLPNVVYRLILTLYVYIIPFIPNAPAILPAFALLVLPLITCLFIDVLFEKKRRRAKQKKSKLGFVFSFACALITVGFVLLVSCRFRYGILVIASPSMADEINVGDAVIYESYDNDRSVAENDVIVFQGDGNKRVVHRVIEINDVDGQRQYITKGDANENPDTGFVTDSQIVGVVRLKVLYIGYPSLWLREIFSQQN